MDLARKAKPVESGTIQEVEKPKVKLTPVKKIKKYDPSERFIVRNGFPGRLFFGSKKTGMSHVWEKLGDIDELTYDELIEIRNQHSGFYANNYLQFEDSDIVRDLLIDRYYVKSLNVDEIESLFDLPEKEIESKINAMPKAQKQTVAYLAIQKIEDGSLDSRKKIKLLETLLEDKLVIEE